MKNPRKKVRNTDVRDGQVCRFIMKFKATCNKTKNSTECTEEDRTVAVSYTHLTLQTICSV